MIFSVIFRYRDPMKRTWTDFFRPPFCFGVIIYYFGGKYCLTSTISKPIKSRVAELVYTNNDYLTSMFIRHLPGTGISLDHDINWQISQSCLFFHFVFLLTLKYWIGLTDPPFDLLYFSFFWFSFWPKCMK